MTKEFQFIKNFNKYSKSAYFSKPIGLYPCNYIIKEIKMEAITEVQTEMKSAYEAVQKQKRCRGYPIFFMNLWIDKIITPCFHNLFALSVGPVFSLR